MFCLPASPAVAPDTINNHVKTCYEEQKNLHFYAPEYGGRLLFVLRSPDLQTSMIVKTKCHLAVLLLLLLLLSVVTMLPVPFPPPSLS